MTDGLWTERIIFAFLSFSQRITNFELPHMINRRLVCFQLWLEGRHKTKPSFIFGGQRLESERPENFNFLFSRGGPNPLVIHNIVTSLVLK